MIFDERIILMNLLPVNRVMQSLGERRGGPVPGFEPGEHPAWR